ncbi:MAG: STAS domain-containing protein [Chitinivibrionales bacterium]|nr:STAS domain-containing protein [Chitinivibrionales bacterium]
MWGREIQIGREQWNGWTILSIVGDFTVKFLVDIKAAFDALENSPAPQVALDLTKTLYLDSSAITMMTNFYERLRKQGGRFVVFGPSEDVGQIFLIVGFDKSIAVYKTREQFQAQMQAL